MMQTNLIKVGMADLHVIYGTGVLKTSGLGSCVGLTLYEPSAKVSGMAHIMLPDSRITHDAHFNKAKYADTAIHEMLELMLKLGASSRNMKAKMAGGAQMFAFSSQTSDMMRIGPRNVETCREVLTQLAIPIVAEDTGGNYGRTIEFSADTGMLLIRSVKQGVKEI